MSSAPGERRERQADGLQRCRRPGRRRTRGPPASTITATAPRAAPSVTPRMSGLASGLRAKVWVSAPERPEGGRRRGRATSVCGSRSSITMNCWPASPPPSRVRTTSATGIVEVAEREVERRPARRARPGRRAATEAGAQRHQPGRRPTAARSGAVSVVGRALISHHPGAADQVDEDRAADQRHHDADLQLAGAYDDPADHVGDHAASSPPMQRGVRDHPAVVDAGEEPGDVRDDEADEHDRAARGGGGAGQHHHAERRR